MSDFDYFSHYFLCYFLNADIKLSNSNKFIIFLKPQRWICRVFTFILLFWKLVLWDLLGFFTIFFQSSFSLELKKKTTQLFRIQIAFDIGMTLQFVLPWMNKKSPSANQNFFKIDGVFLMTLKKGIFTAKHHLWKSKLFLNKLQFYERRMCACTWICQSVYGKLSCCK